MKTIGLKIDFGGIVLTLIRENLDRTIFNNAGLFFLKLLWFRRVSVKTIDLKIDFGGIVMTYIREN